MSEKFDPADFGFELYTPSVSRGKYLDGKDYLLTSSGKTRNSLILSLSPETAEFVHEMFGERVNLYLNDKGYILIADGDRLKVSHATRNDKGRYTISCNGLYDDFVEKYGEFKRLYFDKTLYGSGNALLLKPNGKRDDLTSQLSS